MKSDRRRLGVSLARAVALAMTFSCGDTEILAIARDEAVLADASSVDASLDDARGSDVMSEESSSGDALDAARIEASAPDASTSTVRGRVQVRDGNLFTDTGTPLRGVSIDIDRNPSFPISEQLIGQLSRVGLNTVHVYLEDWNTVTGKNEPQAKNLVDWTERASMYLILAIGGGPVAANKGAGYFDPDKVKAFWSHYAPLYADRTHVIYEIENDPDYRCDKSWLPESIKMERDAYGIIRKFALNTHVVLFSFSDVPTPEVLTDSIAKVDDIVDWSKASVGMHAADGCSMSVATALALSLEVPRSKQIATLITEIVEGSTVSLIPTLENNKIGWMDFHWLIGDSRPTTFKSTLSAVSVVPAVTWCPDFGVWPQNSATCKTQ